MKDASEMTKKEFLAVPSRKWNEPIKPFRSMVILPANLKDGLHDSGYRCMDFVALDNNEKPICRLSGCIDVIRINRVGVYGPPSRWRIDCLAKSGLLRIFNDQQMTCGPALLSFDIYALPPEAEK